MTHSIMTYMCVLPSICMSKHRPIDIWGQSDASAAPQLWPPSQSSLLQLPNLLSGSTPSASVTSESCSNDPIIVSLLFPLCHSATGLQAWGLQPSVSCRQHGRSDTHLVLGYVDHNNPWQLWIHMIRPDSNVCKQTDSLSGSHSEVNIKSTKEAKCLSFCTTMNVITAFAITNSHRFTSVSWVTIWLISRIWPFMNQFFLLTVCLSMQWHLCHAANPCWHPPCFELKGCFSIGQGQIGYSLQTTQSGALQPPFWEWRLSMTTWLTPPVSHSQAISSLL